VKEPEHDCKDPFQGAAVLLRHAAVSCWRRARGYRCNFILQLDLKAHSF
jgi:hypothetical protein